MNEPALDAIPGRAGDVLGTGHLWKTIREADALAGLRGPITAPK